MSILNSPPRRDSNAPAVSAPATAHVTPTLDQRKECHPPADSLDSATRRLVTLVQRLRYVGREYEADMAEMEILPFLSALQSPPSHGASPDHEQLRDQHGLVRAVVERAIDPQHHSDCPVHLPASVVDRILAALAAVMPFGEGEGPKEKPAINTNVRLFDLVRYMRAELHAESLITDDEYEWLCGLAPMATHPEGGSPSPRRLEDYAALRTALTAANAELVKARKELEEARARDSYNFGLLKEAHGAPTEKT